MLPCRAIATALLVVLLVPAGLVAQARVTEETRVLQTYPFSEPNPVPILTRDERLFPYHTFEGYAHDAVPRAWKVLRLENDWIEVYVLPEVGGKVWGAVVKDTGHEFIYRNEVMKFRDIALRGPWTSGGIEFNFGVIGHTPATATPVDYETRENPDGSASVFVGATDLPSRTSWRVEIRLPADRAYFETNVLWHNPTSLEQPYYNWMTAAAFARDDLEVSIPGNAYLEHPGARRAWPVDPSGRYLPRYDQNRFGGSKSYHVVGELEDFFGGYYRDADYGFGHWSRHEEMPGQKLWLWALSREGGIWEDLLTETDGQYIEFQAGRLLVQYSPEGEVNPISQVGFDPGATDRWTETWFPVEGLGGLSDASREGAVFVARAGDTVTIRVHAFGAFADTLLVTSGRTDGSPVLASIPLELDVLRPLERAVRVPAGQPFVVTLPVLGLEYHSDPDALAIARPFSTDATALSSIPEVDRRITEARQLLRGRELRRARDLFRGALEAEPWNRDALLGLADLETRRGRYTEGLTHAERARQLDAYDPAANFAAGVLYRALGQDVDATEAFGWAARSMRYRSAAYVQLAELKLLRHDLAEAARYAARASDYDRDNLAAGQLRALVARRSGDIAGAARERNELLAIDPLHHFVAAERYLDHRDDDARLALLDGLRGEYPEQELLEIAITYAHRGAVADARAVLELGVTRFGNPIVSAWNAWLAGDASRLPAVVDLAFVFPYRTETIAVLEWAVERSSNWRWRYLLAVNLWARDRRAEAARHLDALGQEPDYAPVYVTRAHVLAAELGRDGDADLRRAVSLDPNDRLIRIPLVRYLQERGRWAEALVASERARVAFPSDADLSLLHVRSLNELGRFQASLRILETIDVLPSEHAGISRALFEQAHLLAALDAMDQGDTDAARGHLQAAMTWPERLGRGRPYEPEERLARYLLGHVERSAGDAAAARAELVRVVDGTGARLSGRLDLIGIAASVALGDNDRLSSLGVDKSTDAGRVGRAWIDAIARGDGATASILRLGATVPTLFSDVEGRILLRALTRPAP